MALKSSPTKRRPTQPKRAIAMRVTILDPPPDVAMCLRSKDDDIVDRTVASGDVLSFDFTVRAQRVVGSKAPRLLGPFVYGPPAQRFVYIRIGTLTGQADSCWTRAAKIPLAGITWEMVGRAARGAGRLEARVDGRAKDGGPFCATVPLLDGGWRPVG